MSERETIKALEEKVQSLEKLLEQTLKEKAVLTTIESEPFKHGDFTYYRTAEPSICFYDGNKVFDERKEKTRKLELGQEVMVINNMITQILPEPLKKVEKKEVKNTFKRIGWEEVGGLKSQISRIRESIELPLKHSKLAEEFGLRPVKGILLYGPPGCGKTLIAKAIASMILDDSKDDDSFIYVKGAELLSMWVGATEQQIRSMFIQARNFAVKTGKRAVIFIDEAEAILPRRGSRQSSDVDRTIVPTFLSEMDGFDDNSPIMVFSTNLPNSIDEAILRPGRVDIKIEVQRPTREDAEDIFRIHLNKVKCAIDVDELAREGAETIFKSPQGKYVSGAMIETMVTEAAKRALKRRIDTPRTKHVGIIKEDIYITDHV